MIEDIPLVAAKIVAVRDLTPTVRSLDILPEGGVAPFTPGSHIAVEVRINGRPDRRHYSLTGCPADGCYRIAVRRMPQSRGGSLFMWGFEAGDPLQVSDPRNAFPLTLGRPAYLLLAGGIGITPIHAMAMELSELGADLRLLYGVRSRNDAPFAAALAERLGDRMDLMVEEEGRRIDLARAYASLPAGGEVYVCGPIGMLEAATSQWQADGRPAELLRFETFGSSGRRPAEPFVVRLPEFGREVPVAANETMLDALTAAGIELLADCQRGECGLCSVDILGCEGEVDHRDVFLSRRQKDENRRMCACVSRVSGGGVTIRTGYRPL
jgi:ferredoxin-NADP reductase